MSDANRGSLIVFLLGVLVGASVMSACWEYRTYKGLQPLVYKFTPPPVEIIEEKEPYPVALCFGKTIVGDGVVLQNEYLRAPLLIMGDNTTIISSSFHGNDFGIYIDGESKLWMSGDILINNGLGFAIKKNSKVNVEGINWPLVTIRNDFRNNKAGGK